MKKVIKVFAVTGTALLAVSAASTCYQYRKMKRLEAKLEELPIHRFKRNLTSIHHDEDKTVIEVPKETSFLDRLRMSLHILIP